MDVYSNELNHIIIKDKNQNSCELTGGEHQLENTKKYINQMQTENLNCLLCEIGLPITDENSNPYVNMYIPIHTNLLVISDERTKSKSFRQFKIHHCPLCGRKLEI